MRVGLRSLLVCCLFVATGQAASQAEDRPNFLIILCDDLGYGDLACYGNKTIKTPNLDKLADQGTRLTDCYSAAPVCSPSRAGLLTGRTPNRLGVYDWIPEGNVTHLREDEKTVAKLLKGAGYQTGQFGKWHCNGHFNSDLQPQPDDHGFDHWFATQNNASPTHKQPTNFVRNGEPVGPTKDFSCQVVADEAIGWLERRDPEKPFFMFVCFHEPHEPIDSPEDLVTSYPQATKKGEALYYANVTNMDKAVGKLMAALDKEKLDDSTFVFFTSDNGPETLSRYRSAWRSHGSPGPLRGMKLHLYEAGIRVPGIMRWPGHVAKGAVCDEPVGGVDVLPTCCQLAGVKVPTDKTIDGTSMVPAFHCEPIKRETPLHWHYYRSLTEPVSAMRDGDWVVLGIWDLDKKKPRHYQPGDDDVIKNYKLVRFELYNLKDDLGQRRDLSSAEPERLEKMSEQLKGILKGVQQEAPDWTAQTTTSPQKKG
ncbi:Arylsulfatase [Planctomycetes bacterium Pan216]|uniref:Arylsulfatase n=1 Tax=Kolteria novifilia TaxID=2527975 RepID=A0A518B4C6_9BACT|nr:Arylsulfatase [Planctomycetes bacterium Pan216]